MRVRVVRARGPKPTTRCRRSPRGVSLAFLAVEPLDLPGLVVPVPETGWSVERDLVYARPDGRPLHVDRYAPVEGDARGTVLVLHGEPALEEGDRWWGEDRQVKDCRPLRDWGALLAARGLVAYVANRRCAEGFTVPELVDDDLEALVTFTGSGPHAWLAFSGAAPFVVKRGVHDRQVTAIVTMYGPLDLEDPALRTWFPGLAEERARAWSPAALVRTHRCAPLLHVWPEQDWLPNGVDAFTAAAEASGSPFRVLHHPGGGHGFDFLVDDEDTHRHIAAIVAVLGGRRDQAASSR